jgi:hypothetical protein
MPVVLGHHRTSHSLVVFRLIRLQVMAPDGEIRALTRKPLHIGVCQFDMYRKQCIYENFPSFQELLAETIKKVRVIFRDAATFCLILTTKVLEKQHK